MADTIYLPRLRVEPGEYDAERWFEITAPDGEIFAECPKRDYAEALVAAANGVSVWRLHQSMIGPEPNRATRFFRKALHASVVFLATYGALSLLARMAM